MSIKKKVLAVSACRFLVLMGLAFWLGGLFFFGAMTAPAIFKISRMHHVGPIAPEMVGVMLSRFAFVNYGCGVLMLLGWLGERLAGAIGGAWSRRCWWLQGVCSALMLIIAIYLGNVLMPRINVMQGKLLVPTHAMTSRATSDTAQTVSGPETAGIKTVWSEQLAAPVNASVKDDFDRLHKSYSTWAMIAVYLGMAALAALCLRSAMPLGANSIAEPSRATTAPSTGMAAEGEIAPV